MPQKTVCENGHYRYGSLRQAAREFSKRGTLGKCHRCGKSICYFVSHYYPYDNDTREYDVVKVEVLLSEAGAEKEGWDPMIFLLRDRIDGHLAVWPYYWTKDRNGKWANGQFPPLLNIDDLERVIEKFKNVELAIR